MKNLSLVSQTRPNSACKRLEGGGDTANISVVVQFCPWCKFYFPLFKTHYHTLSYFTIPPKQRKIKFAPRIKLHHNISILALYVQYTYVFAAVEIQKTEGAFSPSFDVI